MINIFPFWLILASLHPCNNIHPNRVSNYREIVNKLNIERFDFTNGYKSSDVHKYEKLKNLSINVFEANFYQDHKKWSHKLILIEVSKNESVIDLLNYKNCHVLNKKFHLILGSHNCIYVCRRCLKSQTSQNVFIKHKQQCGEQDIASLRLSIDSHLYWGKSLS